ncbi:hypothetical protein [Prescottella subtropica]|uniref:hypothetical protein n=1 Tax=Prescottella subtropica TaxID=2545757 RepID=UPI0010F52FDF|nr:hypothetical protein [Prescottella subtropica]
MANLIFGGAGSYRETEEALSRLAARISEAVSEVQAALHIGWSGNTNEILQGTLERTLTAAARLVEAIQIATAYIGAQTASLDVVGASGAFF